MGTLSTGATFVFWLFYTVLILVAYHKLFAVVYFDTVKGLLKEFIIAAIVGIILTGISLSKPIVGIIVIIIVALIGIAKVQSGGGKAVIVILTIVACVIVGVVGLNVQKNMDDSENTEKEVVTERENYKRDEQAGIEQEVLKTETEKKEIRLNDYQLHKRKAEEMEDALGLVAQNAGINIIYLEEYGGYGFSDGSLIMYDEEYGACIIAEYSDLVTITLAGINTDMSLEEARCMYNDAKFEQVPLSSNSESGFKINDDYYITLGEADSKGIRIVMRSWKSWIKEQTGEVFPVDKLLQHIIEGNYLMSAQGVEAFFERAGYEVAFSTNVDSHFYWYSISEGAVWWFDGDDGLEIYLEDVGSGEAFSLYGLVPEMTFEEAKNHLLKLGAVDLGYSEERKRHEFLLYDAYHIYIIPAGEKIVIGATGYGWLGLGQESEMEKTKIDLDAYITIADTADTMAELLLNEGYDIVYLEDYDGYGLSDGSLIIQNYDIGTCIIAENSEETTIFLMGINTDMSLEEADYELTNNLGAVITPLSYEGALTYNLNNRYYIAIYSVGEKGINIVAEPYWGE